MSAKFRSGVLFGDEVSQLLRYANENDFALPAVNVIGSNTINGVLETAASLNAPVIIQFSNGGGAQLGINHSGYKGCDNEFSLHSLVPPSYQVK